MRESSAAAVRRSKSLRSAAVTPFSRSSFSSSALWSNSSAVRDRASPEAASCGPSVVASVPAAGLRGWGTPAPAAAGRPSRSVSRWSAAIDSAALRSAS